jgi:phosphoglycerate-specific signal transduction histidine kinase
VVKVHALEREVAVIGPTDKYLVIANVVPSSQILVTLMMEAIRSSETSALTRATRRHISEDDILHSHRRKNLK